MREQGGPESRAWWQPLLQPTSGLCVRTQSRLEPRALRLLSLEGVTFPQLSATVLTFLPFHAGTASLGIQNSLCFWSLGLVPRPGLACRAGGRAQQSLRLDTNDWVGGQMSCPDQPVRACPPLTWSLTALLAFFHVLPGKPPGTSRFGEGLPVPLATLSHQMLNYHLLLPSIWVCLLHWTGLYLTHFHMPHASE